MQDLLGMIASRKRPSLLLKAARIGANHYSRNRMLKHILARDSLPRTGEAIMTLLELEDLHNERRNTGDANYSAKRHVEVLIALLGEARLLRAA